MFDDLNSSYCANMSLISQNVELQPEMVWSHSFDDCKREYSPKYVFGWLDTGFRNMVKVNDQFYINESLDSAVIIKYEVQSCVLGHRLFQGNWNNHIKTYQQGTNYITELTATRILYGIVDQYIFYDNETRIFYDAESAPLQYPSTSSINITVKEYNDKKILFLENLPWITGYEIITKNGSFLRYKAGTLEYTSKNIPYLNFTNPITLTEFSGNVSMAAYGVLIENTSFQTRFYTPFSEVNVSQNVTVIKQKPTFVSSFVVYFAFITGICFWGIKRMIQCIN